jgi:hypothetical protein
MAYLYDACDQISDFCHQQLLRKMQRKISWTDGRTEVKQYTPLPLRGAGASLAKIQNRAIRFIKRDYRSRERGCITKMRNEIELETLEERRQSLRLILMYKVVEGLVPALPTDAFVTFSKRKRQIKPKTFGDCVTINPVEKHKTNNSKCLSISNSRTAQYQNSLFVDTVIRWNNLPDTLACANKSYRTINRLPKRVCAR